MIESNRPITTMIICMTNPLAIATFLLTPSIVYPNAQPASRVPIFPRPLIGR